MNVLCTEGQTQPNYHTTPPIHSQKIYGHCNFSAEARFEGGPGHREIGIEKSFGCFGSAALVCHRRRFMLLQRAALEAGGVQAPPARGCCSGQELLLQSQKYTHGNDKLLLMLLPQKIIIKYLLFPPPQSALSVSYLQWLSQKSGSMVPFALGQGLLTSVAPA